MVILDAELMKLVLICCFADHYQHILSCKHSIWLVRNVYAKWRIRSKSQWGFECTLYNVHIVQEAMQKKGGQTFLGLFYAGSGIGSFPHLWMLVNGVKGNQSHCDHIELCTPLTGKKFTKVSSPGMLLTLCFKISQSFWSPMVNFQHTAWEMVVVQRMGFLLQLMQPNSPNSWNSMQLA